MNPVEWIRKKRDGGELSSQELASLLSGFLKGEIKDYQMSAWLMAVYFRGMSVAEMTEWTRLMWRSGRTIPRSNRDDFWIDKHSTGGVGDKPSLILVPLVTAVCRRLFGEGRVKIPMVSGRGLGHSGGTLDKLESVPGFSPRLEPEKAVRLLEENGFFMMGQTADVAPADRLLYSLRDVTATVESIPLIVSSILSKKLSENLDGLVLDVKMGTGAFMKTEAQARGLALALRDVAKAQGLLAVALLTRMDEPLGYKVGLSLEVEESADYLLGVSREAGLHEVVLALGAAMISLASRGKLSLEAARGECEAELEKRDAFPIFRTLFEAQGGDWSAFEKLRGNPNGECQVFLARAGKGGYLERIEAQSIGLMVNALGGGRARLEDAVDPGVGVEFLKKVGDEVAKDDPIAKIYYRSEEHLSLIKRQWDQAVRISESPIPRVALVEEILS